MPQTPACDECGQPYAAVTAAIDPQSVDLRFTAACGHPVPRERAATLWQHGYRWDVPQITGARLVEAERARQQTDEGYTPDHDARHGDDGLAWAAWSYVDRAIHEPSDYAQAPGMWPWGPDAWKPDATPLRRLVIAGALIAAEIDRLLARDRRRPTRPEETR